MTSQQEMDVASFVFETPLLSCLVAALKLPAKPADRAIVQDFRLVYAVLRVDTRAKRLN